MHAKREITIRPATRDDVVAHFGRPAEKSARAFAVTVDGTLAVLAGVAVEPGRITAFCDFSPDLAVPKATIWRHAIEIMGRLTARYPELWARRTEGEHPNSRRFLERLGFAHDHDEGGHEFYHWRRA